MTVLVTGATGFIGRNIVSALLSAGYEVMVTFRNEQKAQKVLSGNALRLPSDLAVAFPSELPRLPDAIIHLVGIIRPDRRNTFEKAHIKTTKNVVDFARKWKIRRLIHMSALGTRDHAPSRYHQTKREAEKIVLHSHLNWTIFRPSVIIGPGDRFSQLIKSLIRFFPVVPILGSGKNRLQPIFIQDVVSLFLRALDKKETFGKIYEVGGPEIVSFRKLLQEYAKILHRRRAFLPVPTWMGYLPAFLGEYLPAWFPLNRDLLKMLMEDNICDLNPLFQDFPILLTPLHLALSITLYPERPPIVDKK